MEIRDNNIITTQERLLKKILDALAPIVSLINTLNSNVDNIGQLGDDALAASVLENSAYDDNKALVDAQNATAISLLKTLAAQIGVRDIDGENATIARILQFINNALTQGEQVPLSSLTSGDYTNQILLSSTTHTIHDLLESLTATIGQTTDSSGLYPTGGTLMSILETFVQYKLNFEWLATLRPSANISVPNVPASTLNAGVSILAPGLYKEVILQSLATEAEKVIYFTASNPLSSDTGMQLKAGETIRFSNVNVVDEWRAINVGGVGAVLLKVTTFLY